MALIKPRSRGKRLVRHRTRLDHETNETLYAYAHFIGESTEYVLNQVIDTVLARDKEFLQWRADAPGLVRARTDGRPRPTSAPRATGAGTAASSASGCRAGRVGPVDAH
jgi:hypothetical protein